MNLKEEVYAVWEAPGTASIEEDVIRTIDGSEELSKNGIDRLANTIFDISDKYYPESLNWIEAVVEKVDEFVEKEPKHNV
jgi:hypothetical protein